MCEEHKARTKHCICDNAYNESKILIMCDYCLMWFHGKCLGLSSKDIKEIGSYSCKKCNDWAK